MDTTACWKRVRSSSWEMSGTGDEEDEATGHRRGLRCR